MDQLLYDKSVEETIDLFKDIDRLPSVVGYAGPLLKKENKVLLDF